MALNSKPEPLMIMKSKSRRELGWKSKTLQQSTIKNMRRNESGDCPLKSIKDERGNLLTKETDVMCR